MLEFTDLSFRRGARVIFRALTLSAGAGELVQIMGANGSGKSTLLRILAGLLPVAEGVVRWQGQAMADDRSVLHYVGHQDALKPELTGEEMIGYWQALAGHTAAAFHDAFSIQGFRHKPIRILSAGQRRRLALTRLMLSDAPLWLLDEPATALDREGQALLEQAIAVRRAKGGIVIAAVHHPLAAADSRIFTMPEAA